MDELNEKLVAKSNIKDAKIGSLNEEIKVLKEKLQKEVSKGWSHQEEKEKYSKMLGKKE